MKKFNEILQERKYQYESTINVMNSPLFDDFLANMSEEERKEYLHEMELDKESATQKLNNPDLIEEELKKDLVFDAIKFIESMKYVIENSIDLSELIGRAPKTMWLHSDQLTKIEKIVLLGYQIGQLTFGFDEEDYKVFGGFTNPNFLKNIVSKINSEYGVALPLTDDMLTINEKSAKGRTF